MKTWMLLLGAALLAAATPALARDHKGGGDKLQISISLEDRNVISGYLRDNYRPHCPPGLAKKHNGCLPPGIAKKYRMGKPLPPGIAKKQLPDDLMGMLHPAPGYMYVQVDKDVLLISEATKKVIDAVTLLSAVK